ncbi:MAG: branched-chain amino acid transporter permease [Erysipelotrichaceae bacterium]
MNNLQILATVGILTFALRALPFVLFSKRAMPLWLIKLSKRIPVMILGLLVVYSLKDTRLGSPTYALPEIAALSVLAFVQWKGKNPLVSILLSTGLYVLLLQVLSSSF